MKHMKQDVFEQLGPEEKMISMGLSCMSFSWMISVTFTKKNREHVFSLFSQEFQTDKTLTCQVCGFSMWDMVMTPSKMMDWNSVLPFLP